VYIAVARTRRQHRSRYELQAACEVSVSLLCRVRCCVAHLQLCAPSTHAAFAHALTPRAHASVLWLRCDVCTVCSGFASGSASLGFLATAAVAVSWCAVAARMNNLCARCMRSYVYLYLGVCLTVPPKPPCPCSNSTFNSEKSLHLQCTVPSCAS
jgi:hypothetical protein